MAVRLVPATQEHLQQMMGWFADARSCRFWGGPEFRFPYTRDTFVADSKIAELPTYVLLDASGMLCGFGQYYGRVGRCHLARLVVAPARRGQGLGTQLIRLLMEHGTRELGVTEASLFVHNDNPAAHALYERLGFRDAVYPETMPLDNCHYMVKA